jgi:hypothetical protein
MDRDEGVFVLTDEPAQRIETPKQIETPNKSPFDPVFPQLVNEAEGMEKKLIGFIAYGLYHDAKWEWISDFRSREGRYPHEEELRGYDRSWTTSRLEGLKNAAVQSIAAYTDSVLSQAEAQILRNALNGTVRRAVWSGLLSALLYTLILIGLIVILAKSGIDLKALVERLTTP